MAFVFVLEDGNGLDDATSFASAAEADPYFEIDPNFAATWAALTTSAKQARLARGSRILAQRTAWRGTKAVETSGLPWPREGVYDREQILIASDVVPRQVKEATFELVKYLEGNDFAGPDVEHIKSLEVETLKIEYQDNTSQVTVPPIINDILLGLGTFEVGSSRFVRIRKV